MAVLQQLGFRVDPFGPDVDASYFFVTPALQQRLDLALHLVEFSRGIVVISAVAGSGKSTLLRKIAGQAAQLWRHHALRADPALAPAHCLQQLCVPLGLDLPADDVDAQLRVLGARLKLLHGGGALFVVSVDDAGLLPAETLQTLIALGHDDHAGGGLRLLLAADPDRAAAIIDSCGPAIHVIDLPPWSREQTDAYLDGRCRAAGLPDQDPFGAEIRSEIFAASGGLPGPVGALAGQYLRDDDADVPPVDPVIAPARRPARGLPAVAYWLPAGVAVAGAVLWLLWRPGTTTAPETTTVQLPLPAPVTAPPAALPPSQRDSSPDSAPAAAPEQPAPEPPLAPETASPAPAVANTSETARVADEPAAQPVVTAAPPAPKPAAAATGRPELAELLAQPADHYTLQLFAAHNPRPARELLARADLRDAVGVESVYQGRPWYVVLYGHYPDRKTAMAALARLPEDVRKLLPWARSIASVRDAAPQPLL